MNFSKCGYELLADFLPAAELADMRAEFNQIEPAKSSGGIRNAERQFASVARYIRSGSARAQAKRYLTGSPQLVRAILFNKTALNNWMVPLHQDKTVCLTSKIADPAWGPWSIKDDVLHVQPPIHVLDSMVTIRIHIDDAFEDNGCLAVVPGSHSLGILPTTKIAEISRRRALVSCPAAAGSALAMRPHLLHASAKCRWPTQRRVLHLEYCSHELPAGTSWATECQPPD